MAQASPPTVRQAALALHGLGSSDQQWLLEALGADHRAVLQPLLQELSDIGMPADPRMVGDLGGDVQSKPQPVYAGAASLLANEPPRLAAAFLCSIEPEERQRVLTELAPAARTEILAQEAALARAPALQAAVLCCMQQRLAARPLRTAASPAGVWSRLKQRLTAYGSKR